ncbi:MAG: ATP-binding cassette domain-containing protein, partial [Gemella haemolysans]|nr:ATP-binding cassette domain-containing protein [Gemella haemolysans]
MQILNIKNIEFEKQGKILFKIEKLSIYTGDIIGLIGKNGSGKTTLLKYIDDSLKDENNISSEFLEFGENSLLKKSGGEVVVNKIRSSLLSNVELYLLDEPSTYLDYNNASKIANLIKRTPATFCIASHDRNFLNNVCTKLWIIENNTVREFNGNYHEYKFQEEIETAEYEAELQKYNKEAKKIKKSIQEMKEEQRKKSGKPKNMSGS